MAARRSVKINIDATDNASREVQKADRSIQGLAKSARTTAVAAFGALTAAVAGSAIAFNRWFTAVTAAENATVALTKATENAGTITATSAAEFDAWADSVQAATTTSADQAKQLAALAVQFTGSNEKAKEFTQAALDFAAATGRDATEALKQLTKSTSGLAGELGELVPEIRDLSVEQLKAGGAAELLGQKFNGAAAAAAEGLAPALEQLSNAVDAFIAKTTDGTTGTQGLTNAISSLTDALNDQKSVSTFTTALNLLGDVVGFISDRVSVQRNALVPLQIAYDKLVPVVGSLKQAWEGLTNIQVINTKAIRDNADAVNALVTAQEIGERNQQRATDSLEAATIVARAYGAVIGEDLEEALEKNKSAQEAMNEAYRLGVITAEQYGDVTEKISAQYAKLTGTTDEYANALAEATGNQRDFSDALGSTATAADRAADAQQRLESQTRRVATATRDSSRASSESGFSQNLLGGKSSFAQIGNGTFTGTPGRTVRTLP